VESNSAMLSDTPTCVWLGGFEYVVVWIYVSFHSMTLPPILGGGWECQRVLSVVPLLVFRALPLLGEGSY
jgi:hypothetical protein